MTVLDSFIAFGLPPEKLSVEGYAYYKPIAANDTPDGMAQNRRVEITIFREPVESQGVATEFPSP
jgi:chemotaxis protein MotB